MQVECILYFSVLGNSTAECLALIRLSLKSPTMASQGSYFEGNVPHVFVTLGASVRNTHPLYTKVVDVWSQTLLFHITKHLSDLF